MRLNMTNGICGIEIKRRSATQAVGVNGFRGLKPTATVVLSLRDCDFTAERCSDGSRGLQPTDTVFQSDRVAERRLNN
jgi:hypothetical protein